MEKFKISPVSFLVILGGLQAVIIFTLAAMLVFHAVKGYESLDLDLSKCVSIFMDYGVDGWHMRPSSKGFLSRDLEKVLVANLGAVERGNYTLRVSYTSLQDSYASFDTSNGEWEYVEAGTLILHHAKEEASYDFIVSPGVTKNLELLIDSPYSSQLHIK
ncbi:MAG: hypothetical protein IJU50_04425, partial [Lachnospiraceae bacterium]|nr:hypothetical protein [Lachnospiraceae bacterium]